jgi:predicted nucleic acid-binding protein
MAGSDASIVREGTYFPSQVLPSLLRLFHGTSSIAELVGVPRLRVVVDANAALRELYWLHKTRRNPAARSHFREVVDAGVVVPFAPPQMAEEVAAQFDYFHEHHGIPRDELRRSWDDYRALIKWVPPRRIAAHSRHLLGIVKRHPKDEPYVALAIQIGAAGILTHDPDFDACDVRAYDELAIVALRTHARSAATELGAVAAGSLGFTLAVGLSRGTWHAFRRLPPPIQFGFVALAAAAVMHAWSRRRDVGHRPLALIADLASSGLRSLGEARAARIQHPIADLVNGRPHALVDFAAVICAESTEPVSLRDLVDRIIAEGYGTNSQQQHVYLRRLLRQDRRFVQQGRNRWTLASCLPA